MLEFQTMHLNYLPNNTINKVILFRMGKVKLINYPNSESHLFPLENNTFFKTGLQKSQLILLQMKTTSNLNQQIAKFYKNKTNKKRSNSFSSASKRTPTNNVRPLFPILNVEQNPQGTKSFLRNQKRMAFESPGLQYTDLPGNLKLHFIRPPSPPPELQVIDYTHQVVPLVKVKLPKRKRGQMVDWVYKQMGWEEQLKTQRKSNVKSMSISPNKKSQLADRYQKCNRAITRTSSQNPSIYELVKRQMKMKPYQHYNSLQFFRNVKNGNFQQVQCILKQNSNLAEDFDDQKMTALHWASKQGYVQIVKLLCQKFKANVNAQDNYGRTPLYSASQNRRTECIYRLFIEGAEMTIPANNKKTAKDIAPDLYTKYALQKIQEIKKILQTKRVPRQQFKIRLQEDIRITLDPSSAYF